MISFGLTWFERKEITNISDLEEMIQNEYIRRF